MYPGWRSFVQSAVASILLFGSGVARACPDPVFDHAMKHWPSSNYRLVLFHRLPLHPPLLTWANEIKKACESTDVPLNADYIDGDLTKDAALTWSMLNLPEQLLPMVVVLPPAPERFPGRPQRPERTQAGPQELEPNLQAIWSAPLSGQTAQLLAGSPLRTQIVQDLVAGKAAEFVLVRGGNAPRDQEAQRNLEALLQTLANEPRKPAEQNGSFPLQGAFEEKPIQYSVRTVDPHNAAESVFLATAWALSPEIKPHVDHGEPVIIALYGRGRAFPPWEAEHKDTTDRITQICELVTGSCSCQIKAQRPGVGLLFAAEWNTDHFNPDAPAAPLPIVAPPTPAVAAPPPTPPAPPPLPAAPPTATTAAPPSIATLVNLSTTPPPAVATQPEPAPRPKAHSTLRQNLTWTAVTSITLVLLLSAYWLLRRRS